MVNFFSTSMPLSLPIGFFHICNKLLKITTTLFHLSKWIFYTSPICFLNKTFKQNIPKKHIISKSRDFNKYLIFVLFTFCTFTVIFFCDPYQWLIYVLLILFVNLVKIIETWRWSSHGSSCLCINIVNWIIRLFHDLAAGWCHNTVCSAAVLQDWTQTI